MKCRNCRMKYSRTEKLCPNCGAENTRYITPEAKRGNRIDWIMSLCPGLLLVVGLGGEEIDPEFNFIFFTIGLLGMVGLVISLVYILFFRRKRPDVVADMAEYRVFKQQIEAAKPRIVSTLIVMSYTQNKATSAMLRSALGSTLIGPVGLLAGIGAKKKQYVTFSIIWSDGSNTTETVTIGSGRYRELVRYAA